MRIVITPSADIVTVDGVRCRRWLGLSDDGVVCEVLVHRIAVREGQASAEFERQLIEMPEPLPPIDVVEVLARLERERAAQKESEAQR